MNPPKDLSIMLDGDTYMLRHFVGYAEVRRYGSEAFCSSYEDATEALHFFASCVGMAYLREKFPELRGAS